jgi:hypothetical protein
MIQYGNSAPGNMVRENSTDEMWLDYDFSAEPAPGVFKKICGCDNLLLFKQ